MKDDLLLQQRVIDELEFEPSVDAAHIGVSVRGGVVTLSGHVDSFAEKFAAERTGASRESGQGRCPGAGGAPAERPQDRR
jgi:osmotically-inducible protein OsmY